jgi:hypothetical protein
MGLANQNVAIVNAVSLGNNGPTLELNNRQPFDRRVTDKEHQPCRNFSGEFHRRS